METTFSRDIQGEIAELAEKLCPFDAMRVLDADFADERALAHVEARAQIYRSIGGWLIEVNSQPLNSSFSTIAEACEAAQRLSHAKASGWSGNHDGPEVLEVRRAVVVDTTGPLKLFAYENGCAR